MNTLSMQLNINMHRAVMLLVMIGLISSFSLHAQTSRSAINDMQAVSDNFRNKKQFYDMAFNIYDQKKPDEKALEKNKVSCYIWYPYSVFKYKETEFYHNDKMKVAVHAKTRKVIVNRTDKKADKAMLNMQFDVDSLLMYYEKIELLNENESTKTYRIFYKPNMEKYTHVDISFNSKLFTITRINLYYRGSMKDMYGNLNNAHDQKVVPRVEIVYSNYKDLKKADWELFYAKHIVVNKGNKISLTPAYSNYTLSNYYRAQ